MLYNSKANIINTSYTIPFSFEFSRINLFATATTINDAISLENLPTYSWYKSELISKIEGTFNSNTITISTNSFTEEDLKNLPALTNFIFANKKALSIGTFLINIKAITEKDTLIKGITLANASILIQYNDVTAVFTANEEGIFEYTLANTLDIGTIIKFNAKENNNLIYKTKEVQIVYSGEIIIESAPTTINFNLKPISINPLLCGKNESVIIKITDTRINKTPWNLYASINEELTSNGKSLNKGLIFYDENENIFPLCTSL